jgi:site-specific DNA-methyltransferase (adenine-specific)
MIDLRLGDCLEVMKTIPGNSIDMILCDLPYGTTACKWDVIIPFELLWKQYNRIIKPNGAIVLFAAQPFTSELVHSNIENYKHHWVWIKEKGTGFQVAKYRPMMKTEDIIMFSKKTVVYNPQMILRDKPITYKYPTVQSRSNPLANYKNKTVVSNYKYPENTLFFKTERGKHPTQKPVGLLEYLIKTYTNESATILDNCMGSGSTGVACINLNRNFIGIEIKEEYFNVAKERIENTKAQESLEL